MIRLSKSQVLLIHDQLIAETGGSSGLRDEGMLDSAPPHRSRHLATKMYIHHCSKRLHDSALVLLKTTPSWMETNESALMLC